jgi:antitoxin FitA
MGVLVQIRDLPEPVHRTLKARAAASGTSLSEYLRALLAREAARPTPGELSARISARGRVELAEPSEAAVRRLRDSGE